MRIEIRRTQVNGTLVPRGLVLVAECNAESELIDEVFGNKVLDGDGLIAKLSVDLEVRLSDGYGDHYIYLKAPHEGQRSQDRTDNRHGAGRAASKSDGLVHTHYALADWNPSDDRRQEPTPEFAAG
jgi:hypothetical protein